MAARILTCDDDETFSKMLRDALEHAGYAVDATRDPTELAARIAADDTFDLVITDFQMAGGGGPAGVRRIRARPKTAALPILVLSAMPIAEQAKWFQGIDRIAFMRKPIELAKLYAAVAEMLKPQAGLR